MMTLRPAAERGHARFDWLDSRHSFSFGHYHDPRHMGFRSLRVINEDRVEPGRGFGTHGHADMEIVSYVLSGALEHKDSLGTGAIIRPGEVQRMTAGSGITHSEFNPSASEPVHFLQIWILPERKGLKPGYEQIAFAPQEKQGRFRLVAARDGRDGAVTIHQDAEIHSALLAVGDETRFVFRPGRHGWVQIARGGPVEVNGVAMVAGDGLAVSAETELGFRAKGAAEILLFDLA